LKNDPQIEAGSVNLVAERRLQAGRREGRQIAKQSLAQIA